MSARVLIVDDSLTVRMDLAETFEQAGFEVTLCASLAEARRALQERHIRLVVLDVLLPDGDGVDLLVEIKSRNAMDLVPVILLSSETEVKRRITGLEKGADDYLGKPYEAMHVLQRARELLGQASPVRDRHTVLVIDDSLTFCEEMREQLEAAGYAVVVAATGEEGLKKAAEIEPDAIIVDGLLPGIDGATTVRRIRLDPVLQRTPCLFLTGCELVADEVAALDAGADAYIRKKDSTRVILGRLSALLRAADHSRARLDFRGPTGVKKIMLLSRSPATTEWVPPVLRQDFYDVLVSQSDDEAFQLLALQPVDCVLLDFDTVRSSVIDVCSRLRASPLLEQIPIVALSKHDDRERMIEMFEAGIDDWIAADQRHPNLMLARIRALMRRKEVDDRERRIRQTLSQRAYELEQANDELAEYKEVVDQMPMGIALARWEDKSDLGSFRFLWANKINAQATRLEPETYVGKTLAKSLPALLATELPGLYAKASESGQPQRLPQLRWGDGDMPERVWDVVAAPISGKRIAILSVDVTEREHADAARRKMEQQMRAAQRMEAVGRLAGGIAHDFNNVMTVIQAYAGFLRKEFREEDPARKDIDVIRDAADRAARLTGQLLAFSRRQPQEIAIVDVNRTVSELESMLRRMIGEDIDLVTHLQRNLGLVKTDITQVEQILMNLAVNARDAMPSGGRLTIETANVTLDETYRQRKHADMPVGDYIMIAVSDNGVGMKPEMAAHVFEPFFTTKEKGKGTGLGLSTVYGIVRQNKGYIWVYSEPGCGTTFKVYLPRVEAAQPTASPRKATPAVGGDETILVVEDEEVLRHVARRILEGRGYNVLEAANGGGALIACEKFKDRIDLVLTDVVMPEMSGKELVDRLNQIKPGARVVYMSGYTDNAIFHHGVLDTGTVYLQKPFSPDELLRTVRRVLDAQ